MCRWSSEANAFAFPIVTKPHKGGYNSKVSSNPLRPQAWGYDGFLIYAIIPIDKCVRNCDVHSPRFFLAGYLTTPAQNKTDCSSFTLDFDKLRELLLTSSVLRSDASCRLPSSAPSAKADRATAPPRSAVFRPPLALAGTPLRSPVAHKLNKKQGQDKCTATLLFFRCVLGSGVPPPTARHFKQFL